MQRPEEKKHPPTLDPQELPRSRLGCVRRRARDGDMFLITPDTVVSLGNASTSATDRSTRQATWWAGMEACIAKGGCKGYISAGSRLGGWHLLRLPVGLGSALERSFFRVCPFLLLCLHPQITPFFLSDCILSFSGLFLFNKKLLGGWRWSTVGGKGGEGVLGERTGGMLFYSHTFSLLSMGPRLSPCCHGGVPKWAPSTKTPAQGQLLMVQSETKSLISEP